MMNSWLKKLFCFLELSVKPASHLHQRLLRQLRSLKGYRTTHVGCDWISETVTRTGWSLEAVRIGAHLGVAAGERGCRTDWSEWACTSQRKRPRVKTNVRHVKGKWRHERLSITLCEVPEYFLCLEVWGGVLPLGGEPTVKTTCAGLLEAGAKPPPPLVGPEPQRDKFNKKKSWLVSRNDNLHQIK